MFSLPPSAKAEIIILNPRDQRWLICIVIGQQQIIIFALTVVCWFLRNFYGAFLLEFFQTDFTLSHSVAPNPKIQIAIMILQNFDEILKFSRMKIQPQNTTGRSQMIYSSWPQNLTSTTNWTLTRDLIFDPIII